MKVNLLYSLSAFFFFLFLINQPVFAQQNLSAKGVEKIIEVQKATFETIFTQPDVAIQRIDSLIKVDEEWPDTLRVNNFKTKGVYYAVINELDSALVYFKKGLNLLNVDDNDYLNLTYNIAETYKNKNDYNAAIQIIDKGIKLAVKENEAGWAVLGKLYGVKASCYSRLQLYSYALENELKGIEYLKKANSGLQLVVIAEHNLANLYMLMGENERAIKIFNRVIKDLKQIGRKDTYFLANLNLSKCYLSTNQLQKAKDLIEFSRTGLKRFKNANLLSYADELTLEFYLKTENWEEVKVNFEKLLGNKVYYNNRLLNISNNYIAALREKGDTLNAKMTTQKVYLNLIKNEKTAFGLEDKIRFYKYALEYLDRDLNLIYRKQTEVQQEYIDYTQQVRNKQLELAYKSDIFKKEKDILSKQVILSRNKTFILFLLVLILIIILIVILYTSHQNKKIKSLELIRLDEEKQQLEKTVALEKEINKLKEQEIENRKVEIVNLTIDRAKLRSKIHKILNELDSKQRARLHKSIKDITKDDKYWHLIQEKYLALNPEFVQKLKCHFPQITNSQLQFCSLIKMYLSNKEIASLLNITPESVLSKKYRLKKKFNLHPDEDIHSFIQSL